MANTVEVVFSDLAGLIERVGVVIGVVPGAEPVLQISALVLRSASGVAHIVEAAEIERIRHSRELGTAAGQSAWEASHQTFKKAACENCKTPLLTPGLCLDCAALALKNHDYKL
jgi:hypothetical protein